MNNSRLIIDKVSLNLDEISPDYGSLQESESKYIRIIEALAKISKSEEWRTLKTLIFDGAVESLEKRLRNEANSVKLNEANIYRLQGELHWAEKYADLNALAESYKLELSKIKRITQPTER